MSTLSPLRGLKDKEYKGKLYLKHWFEAFEEPDDKGKTHKCKMCDSRVKWKGKTTGYKTFIQHVLGHSDWRETMERCINSNLRGPLDEVFTVTKKISNKAKNIYGWIEQIVFGSMPFSISEDEIFVKYSTLSPVSTDTIVKYIEKLGEVVEKKLKQILPDKFSLIIDSWTNQDEHYTATFAAYTDSRLRIKEYLLSCGPQDLPDDDETSELEEESEEEEEESSEVEGPLEIEFTAEDYGDYIIEELRLVGKRYDINLDLLRGFTIISSILVYIYIYIYIYKRHLI